MPIICLLDHRVRVPFGLLTVRLIPADVLVDARQRAEVEKAPPTSRLAGAAIIALWLALAVAVGYWAWRAW